jgi:hypothetical protein
LVGDRSGGSIAMHDRSRLFGLSAIAVVAGASGSPASAQQHCIETPIPCMSGSPHSACVITRCSSVAHERSVAVFNEGVKYANQAVQALRARNFQAAKTLARRAISLYLQSERLEHDPVVNGRAIASARKTIEMAQRGDPGPGASPPSDNLPSKPPSRPDRRPRNTCSSDLAKRYFNERQQCDARRDTSNDVCRDMEPSNPQRPGCYAQTLAVYGNCLKRLATIYPAEIRQCPSP